MTARSLLARFEALERRPPDTQEILRALRATEADPSFSPANRRVAELVERVRTFAAAVPARRRLDPEPGTDDPEDDPGAP